MSRRVLTHPVALLLCRPPLGKVSLMMNPRGSKHVGDINNLEKCAFLCFVLYNYVTMHGAKNVIYNNECCGSIKRSKCVEQLLKCEFFSKDHSL